MADNGDNGNGKAWGLLVAAIERLDRTTGRLDESVTDLRGEIAEARTVAGLQGAAIDHLPCTEHRVQLADLKHGQTDLQDAIKNRLSWRALLTAAIPALVAGAMLGSKFL